MRRPGPRLRKVLGATALAGIAGFGAIQLVPYGRDHTNPPVAREPDWDSPATADLAERACFDCHSNETEWPWYSYVAPASWFVYRDVVAGREELNFSEMGRAGNETDKAAESVEDAEMPPFRYVINHPEARLDDQERQALIRGLQQTLGTGD
ncbi:MAG TPA: heme-binding domain-containing protein [Actinomycetota bacterium]|nr:heme-binding domain-containing protein [Actinomycetota bacterium]